LTVVRLKFKCWTPTFC